MKIIKSTILVQFIFISLLGLGQIPAHYYDAAVGLRGDSLKTALHSIIKNHTVVGYSGLWAAYYKTDATSDGHVWDIYSDIPSGTAPYVFSFGSDQCGGSYSQEGDCYNREHSFPASWFNDQSPMYSDLFHLYPTDGWVNNKRGNLPYGEVQNPTWTSQNGSKLGSNVVQGYTGLVFEPLDSFKGDLARTYFYMMTRYYTQDASWPGSDMVTGCLPKDWALQMLYYWHTLDPVSQKELNRNDSIFKIQNNRNPYIDHPDWAAKVLGLDPVPVTFVQGIEINNFNVRILPNPASESIHLHCHFDLSVKLKLEIFSIEGKKIKSVFLDDKSDNNVDIQELPEGFYFAKISNPENETYSIQKFIKVKN